jgi:hemoglobin
MKTDIAGREDLLKLVSLFYKKLLTDNSINYIFIDVAKIDLPHHLDTLVDFWDNILFQNDVYRKNAMQPHLLLHQQTPLQKQHFETWLKYFNESVDELFEGEKAFLVKERALSIATVMQIKISQLS